MKDYAWNPSLCARDWDKDCKIDEYLKNYACWKNVIDDFVIACDEISNIKRMIVFYLALLPSDKKYESGW